MRTVLLSVLFVLGGWYVYTQTDLLKEKDSTISIKPLHPLHPRQAQADLEKIVLGGKTGPDGKTPVVCYLPESERLKNTGGRDGAGLCVFTSIYHAGRWQNVEELRDFRKKMESEPGGGYPEKVTAMLEKYAPDVKVIQVESNDPSVVYAALATHRMPCITYDGHDPHYGNQTISHMVNAVGHGNSLVCVLDNNFIDDKDLVWLTEADFVKRYSGDGGGWTVVLLNVPPPPEPWN